MANDGVILLSGSDCVLSCGSAIGEDARMGILTERDLKSASEYLRNTLGLNPVHHEIKSPGNEFHGGVFLDKPPAAHVLVCEGFLAAIERASGQNADITDQLYGSLNALQCDDRRVARGQTLPIHGEGTACIGDTRREGVPEDGVGTVHDRGSVAGFSELDAAFVKMFEGKGAHISWHMRKFKQASDCCHNFIGSDIGTWGMARIAVGHPSNFEVTMQFQWWFKGMPIGWRRKITMKHGTLVLLDGDYALGRNWRKANELTIRNALGNDEQYVPSNNRLREMIRKRRFRMRVTKIRAQMLQEPLSGEEKLAKTNAERTRAYFRGFAEKKRAEGYDADVEGESGVARKRKSRKRVSINLDANTSVTVQEVDARIAMKAVKKVKIEK